MRTLTYLVASSLDGFIAGPDGTDPSAWWPVTPDYLEHVVEHYPETLPGPARAALGISGPGAHFDTVVEGRKSFELGLAAGLDDAYPHLRHLVVSSTLSAPAGSAVEVVDTDPLARVRALKQEPGGGIWLVGGGTLAASLRPEIDRLVVKLAPLTLGAGIPLWGRDATPTRRDWRLSDRVELPGGVLVLTYEAADHPAEPGVSRGEQVT